MRDPHTHFIIKGPLHNCILKANGMKNEAMSVNEAGDSKLSKGAGTNLSIKSLGSILFE